MKDGKLKVAVGLSGGVDSSVAASLLKQRGHDVMGIAMEIFDGSMDVKKSDKHACYGPNEKEDVDSAASVCKQLGIQFFVIDLKKEFKNHVIDYFRNRYLEGLTPNPCIVCNYKLKFGFLLEKAKEAGVDFEFFATGHYARIKRSGERILLRRAADLSKDQSYFLYTLTSEQLSRTIFPLGEFTKKQVRDIALSMGLDTAHRPESQDFISGGDYSLLFRNGEIKDGDILDEKGDIIGRHRGVIHYTIGQRRGLGISSKRPLYVKSIDAAKNTIVVSNKENIFSKGLIAKNVNLIDGIRLDRKYRVKAKIRLQHREVNATFAPQKDSKAKILFHEPQVSVTPGQSIVLYAGDIVLGGGIIEKAL